MSAVETEDQNHRGDNGDSLSGRVRIPLTMSDRCDGPGVRGGVLGYCGAQAFVKVVKPPDGGFLLMCGHHYAQFEVVFITAGFDIQDERFRINDKPSPGNADI